MKTIKKRISSLKDLKETLSLTLTEREEYLFNIFLKKKIIHVIDGKIIYPGLEEVRKKKKEIEKNIESIEKEINFWKNTKNKVERNKLLFPITIYFKKNFWRHKVKEITNKEYRQDVIDTKLNDKILLDPEYSTLFETFLLNPDYRKKLKETVNTSIVYKHNSIGGYSEKKKEFKIKTSEMKLEQLNKQLEEYTLKREMYTKVYEVIKKHV